MRDKHKILGKLLYEKQLFERGPGNNDAAIAQIQKIIDQLNEEIRIDKQNSASVVSSKKDSTDEGA